MLFRHIKVSHIVSIGFVSVQKRVRVFPPVMLFRHIKVSRIMSIGFVSVQKRIRVFLKQRFFTTFRMTSCNFAANILTASGIKNMHLSF